MRKKAVSLTLGEDNLLWLKGRAAHQHGNLSAAVDQLIADARAGRVGRSTPPRSVVGTIDLPADDPELKGADKTIQDLFAASLARPSVVRESGPTYGAASKFRRKKPGRG
jgi:hypothetical protein